MSHKTVFTLFVIAVCFQCDNEPKLESRAYPSIDTEKVTDITDGATLHGKFLALGTAAIKDYGFVYSPDYTSRLGSGEFLSLGNSPQLGEFTARVDRCMDKGTTVYYMAYAVTESGRIVYGEQKYYRTSGCILPKITQVIPTTGYASDTITIVGSGFSNSTTHTSVLFGSFAARLLRSSNDSIFCISPSMPGGDFEIEVKVYETSITTPIKFNVPQIIFTSFSPNIVTFGDTITIKGSNFPPSRSVYTVLLGKEAGIVKSDHTELRAVIPNNLTKIQSTVDVSSGLQTVSSPENIHLRPPAIDEIAPNHGPKDTEVTLYGNSFSPVAQNNKVKIGGVDATVVSATTKTLVAKVPNLAPATYTFTLTILGQSAESVAFQVE